MAEFRFYTRMHLSELTGVKAYDLKELLLCVRSVNGSCIYHHTHRFLQQHEYLNPEPANDFAYWVKEALGEDSLSEKLASIDTVSFSSIKALREEIAGVLSSYIENQKPDHFRKARPGNEFNFIKSVSFVFPLKLYASDAREFVSCVKNLTSDSLYFHMFESRLRLGNRENDFSGWLRYEMHMEVAADKINRLDPYTHTVDELRRAIVEAVDGEYNEKFE